MLIVSMSPPEIRKTLARDVIDIFHAGIALLKKIKVIKNSAS